MKLAAMIMLGLLTAAQPAAAADSASPHGMVKPNGEVDVEKCAACHEADMSLSRSKLETCTLCHAETVHGGAYEHLHAAPAAVSRLLAAKGNEKNALLLRDDGGIYCGTCHFFHDPRANGEPFLADRRPVTPTGVAKAVGDAVAAQWEDIARKYSESSAGAHFASARTKALRLQVDDGALCLRCHASMGR